VFVRGTNLKVCAGRQRIGNAHDVENLTPGQLEGHGRRPVLELEREHAHVDQVAAVNTFVAFGDHRIHTEQQCSLCSPVARRT
jgi:hypothetical protein